MSVIALPAIGYNFHRGIYLLIFALVVGIVACWFGITAMQRARRAGTMRPRGAVAGIVIGVIGALVSMLLLVGIVAFWPQFNDFSRCMQSANTPSAQQACQDQLNRSVGISGLRPTG
jgi:ABC-type amino acid transport system permease subunit